MGMGSSSIIDASTRVRTRLTATRSRGRARPEASRSTSSRSPTDRATRSRSAVPGWPRCGRGSQKAADPIASWCRFP